MAALVHLSLALSLIGMALCGVLGWRLGWRAGEKHGRRAERNERIAKRAASLLHRTERKLSLIPGGDDAA
jgi:cytochrome b561